MISICRNILEGNYSKSPPQHPCTPHLVQVCMHAERPLKVVSLSPVPAVAGGINMQLGCSDKWILLGHRGDACDIK